MRTPTGSLILLLMTSSAFAASEWDTRFSRGEAFERAGRYEQAAAEFEAALRAAPSDDVKRPVTWNNLGVVCRELGRTRDAERYYRLAIAYYETHPGLQPSLATTLENLAALDLTLGRISKAEPLYRRSYEIRRGVLPADDPKIADSLHGLARLEQERHRYPEAEVYYLETLAIQENAFGEASLKIAPALHNFAALLAEAGRTADARAAYQRVLAIYRSAAPGHPAEAIVLRHLAELDASAGLASRADEEFRSALAICRSVLPAGHPQTGVILQAYGMFLRESHRGTEAAAVIAEANGILSKSARDSGSAYVVDASAWRAQ